jgi:8-oxo-dGTP pyrophosphatase MutT (NUDIX family)
MPLIEDIRYNWNKFLNVTNEQEAGIIVCLNADDQFLIIRRSDIDARAGQWTIPGGHIDDKDISIEAGAIRELKEETNLSCSESNLTFLGEPKPKKYYFLTQEWTGDVKIDMPNPETGEIEHDDFRWASINEIKDIDNSEIPIYLLEEALEMSKNETNT